MVYVTYQSGGQLKRATMRESQVRTLYTNPSNSDIVVHATRSIMESYYSECSGGNCNTRRTLLG